MQKVKIIQNLIKEKKLISMHIPQIWIVTMQEIHKNVPVCKLVVVVKYLTTDQNIFG